MAIYLALGTVTSLIFQIFYISPNEGRNSEKQVGDTSVSNNVQVDPMSVLDWMKEPQTYQVRAQKSEKETTTTDKYS